MSIRLKYIRLNTLKTCAYSHLNIWYNIIASLYTLYYSLITILIKSSFERAFINLGVKSIPLTILINF